ncbi:carboxyl-terminal protease [Bacteroides coprosuis DSM 18011]|uniref:Carboxyl-terminal protease n=1 Tax=Bacteroides coprosuis DSM 18011 TaxID=679937 RepID=F3ZR78_9BACE|nr:MULTISPECIES: S41 family peptidase [Bacteroides]EGJ70671.1 carboxyl-terminal protease [Bacteroides coprosuis DSM 18011]
MKNGIKKLVISLSVVVGIAVFFSFRAEKDHNFEVAKNLDIFNSIVKELDMFYVDTIDPNVTIRRAIDAMLYSLDPHTSYYPADDQSELEQMIKGSYGGIGSIISYDPKNKYSVIAEPYEGMPAAEVGLKVGDILLQIDDTVLSDKDNQQVSEMLRGEIGTNFVLKVKRPGVEKPLDFTITRKSIQLPTIPYYGVLKDKVGYIEFVSFSGTPAADFKKAFVDLKNQGIESLIIDLRSNGGGLLDEAVEIVNYFVPKGDTIVTTKGKIKQASNTYVTKNQPLDTEIPIVLLVGGSTASAAEILAGSLQDLDRGVVIGNKTFGKGLVQIPRALPYGANMKLTSAKYYIPSGRCVQAIDYSHRDADGKVERIPDSLMTVFHTSIGREVKDGAGIMPDIEVKQDKLPNILFYLVTENHIFNYATDYCLKHKKIAPAKDFALSEADYQEFKEYIKGKDFKYDQQSEKVLSSLKEIAEFEGYLEESKSEFEALEKKLSHNIDKDLDYFSKDIKHILSLEIVKRYYFQKGSTIERLKQDKEVDEAVGILKGNTIYKNILSPAFKPMLSDSISVKLTKS